MNCYDSLPIVPYIKMIFVLFEWAIFCFLSPACVIFRHVSVASKVDKLELAIFKFVKTKNVVRLGFGFEKASPDPMKRQVSEYNI